MRFAEPFDLLFAIAGQPDMDLILARAREGVRRRTSPNPKTRRWRSSGPKGRRAKLESIRDALNDALGTNWQEIPGESSADYTDERRLKIG